MNKNVRLRKQLSWSNLRICPLRSNLQSSSLSTVTRAHAWKRLHEDGCIDTQEFIPEQRHPRKSILVSKFSELDLGTWEAEPDMYPDIRRAIEEGLYNCEDELLVVDTHQNSDFHADISIAEYDDSWLTYSLRYYLELKHPTVELRTVEHCGQILDYFHVVREKQPHRSLFVAILSNFSSAWVYVVPKIYEYPCQSLADAVIYADTTSKSQMRKSIPRLDKKFESKYSVLAVGMHYFLLSVINPPSRVPAHTSTRNQETTPWKPPARHCDPKGQFVLKVALDDSSLKNEIRILTKLRNAQCRHLLELVWAPEGNKQLGTPIQPGEPAIILQKVIQGMIEGLRYLHGEDIVHREIREIRLSNLILKRKGNDINVVIIDYETACDLKCDKVKYSGGYICWPKRLLEARADSYIPEAADDLYASILVTLHMLFPSRFDTFDAGKIGLRPYPTPETSRILQAWKEIEASKIWGRFYVAPES